MEATLEKEALLSVAKVVEITSSSTKSFEDAIQSGVARASKTLEEIRGIPGGYEGNLHSQVMIPDGDGDGAGRLRPFSVVQPKTI
jgi:hypothetical protein